MMAIVKVIILIEYVNVKYATLNGVCINAKVKECNEITLVTSLNFRIASVQSPLIYATFACPEAAR